MFGRVVTAMVTPFQQDGAIDWTHLEKLIEHLLATGSDGIVVCGTTAESPTLTHEEKIALYRFTVKQVAGRAKIIAGTGSNNTAETIALSKEAENCGVDALLLVAPYYNKPSQEGMYRHYTAIAEQTSLPIMLYNVPGRTSSNLLPETVVRLAELPNIVSIKEASGDLDQISLLARQLPEDVTIYSGDDSMILPILAIGGVGVVSVASHVIGDAMQEMIQSYERGEVRRATQLHQQLYPAFTGVFIAPSPAPVKYALSRLGLCAPVVRQPLLELTAEEKHQMDQWIKELV